MVDAPQTPQTPQTPYREGKRLAEIIAPDRRRQKVLALILGSMIAGVALWELGGLAASALRTNVATRVYPTQGAGRIMPAVLHGPEHDVAMPPGTLSIIHVWLQGCQDCMPAFEAMRRLEDEGGLGVDVPIYNVAYGEADPTWAMRYGVRTNLVYDAGGLSVVRPLGISTFTTLVVDKNGAILLRDRPDRPGYRARIRAAVHAEDPRDARLPAPGDPLGTDDPPAALDSESIQRVIAVHRAAIKRTCWERGGADDGPATVKVTVNVVVATTGAVLSTSSSGTDPVTAKCVEAEIKAWSFPARRSGATVSIPFTFARQ